MLVGRIVMLDFVDEIEAEKMLRFLSQNGKTLFKSAVSFNVLKTTPSSGMTVTIYPDEKTAEIGANDRDHVFKEWSNSIVQTTILEAEVSSVFSKTLEYSKY
tara:strand:+ start:190 stop:495 length:306 start_codon:yes stop_codon:yes gene_type:complete